MNEAEPGSAEQVSRGGGAEREEQLVLVAQFRAHPGRADVLRSRLVEMVRLSGVEPGCLRYELHVDEGDAEHLVLLEMWSDQCALDRHMQTHHVQGLLKDVPQLAIGDIEMLQLRPISS
jgi:quinol monooxygenase YgiN